MRIEALWYTDAAGARAAAERLTLVLGAGIEGDHGKRDGRVILLAAEAEIGPAHREGLCVSRFFGHIVTRGLDYAALAPGMRLSLGTAALRIERVGKRCFPECALRARGETCPLPGGVAFASIEAGGSIARGEEIVLAHK